MKGFSRELKRVFIHIRWPLQSFALMGFLFALVVLNLEISKKLIMSLTSIFLLSIGATLFDSYYDKDEKPVAGLSKPPKVSSSLLYGAWFFKIMGFLFALQLNKIFQGVYLIGVLASVSYSHKNFRLKSNGYLEILFNFAVGASIFVWISTISWPAFRLETLGSFTSGFFLAFIYLLMQIHQIKEDKARGEKSLAVMFGKKKTLNISIVLLIIAGIFGITTFLSSSLPKIFILVATIYFIAILFLIIKWRNTEQNSEEDFKTMNNLTIRSSYIANIILLVFYILRIKNVV